MSPRIALVSGHEKNWNAGASTVFLHLEQELSRNGHDVTLFHLPDYTSEKPLTFRKFTTALQLDRRLGPTLRDFDIVEVTGGTGWKAFQRLGRSRWGYVPVMVARLHGLEFKDEQSRVDEEIAGQTALPRKYKLISRHLVNWQERRTLAAADVVVCHSSRDADAIVAAGWKREPDIELMPLGVDERFFGARAYHTGGSRLIWWGSWIERKGISSVPRAFELACRERPDLTLTIGGSGAPADVVLSAFPLELRSRVRVLPFVTPEQHLEALRSHDIFVFPSLSEGFGLALLEAMATGLPAVTTFTGLAHDCLEHGENCLLVPMSAPTCLSRALLRVAGSEALREKLGTNAQETAKRLSWEAFGRRTAEVYADRLARKRRRTLSEPVAGGVEYACNLIQRR